MTLLKAQWLPDGQIELAQLPFKAERELREVSEKTAQVEAVYTKYIYLNLTQAIYATCKILTSAGAAEAKQSWDNHMVIEFPGDASFIWPAEKFEENLGAWRDRILFRQLRATDLEDAKTKIDEFTKNLAEEAKGIDEKAIAMIGRRQLLLLYWHLRGTGLKEFKTPSGMVAIDWALEKKEAVIEVLSEVAGKDDLEALTKKKVGPRTMEDYAPLEVADVLGKSSPSLMSSTDLKPSSSPSSESPSAL